ncbi:MAG TPA: hypothetical protein DDZ84_03700 [Firmicutes bacterium]|nr:hypothetical protein [Bacillota bacterium]
MTIKGPDTGVPNAMVSFESFGTATTDSNGYWTKSRLEGLVRVSVAKHGWTFTPPRIPVSGIVSDVDFEGWEFDYRGLSETASWQYDAEFTSANENKETWLITHRVDRVEESDSATLFHISSFSSLSSPPLPSMAMIASARKEYIIKREGPLWVEGFDDDGNVLCRRTANNGLWKTEFDVVFAPYTGLVKLTVETDLPTNSPNYCPCSR